MVQPEIVNATDWQAAREHLLAKEKAATRTLDAIAAERRRLPMAAVPSDYQFIHAQGRKTLLDLFDGREQLIVYHHMLKPQDDAPCAGCCMFTDTIGSIAHLNARNTSFIVVAKAPLSEIQALSKRLKWNVPTAETTDTFSAEMGITDGFGLSVFLRDGEKAYRSYFTTGRGVEALGSTWSLLDLTPLGRQETWEDSPTGWPQSNPYAWWRLNDGYAIENQS